MNTVPTPFNEYSAYQGRRKMFQVRGAERQRRENRPGGSGGMLLQKIFDFWLSETRFPAFCGQF